MKLNLDFEPSLLGHAIDASGQRIRLGDIIIFPHPMRSEKIVFAQIRTINDYSRYFTHFIDDLFMVVCYDITLTANGSTETFTPIAHDVTLVDIDDLDSRLTEAKLTGTLHVR